MSCEVHDRTTRLTESMDVSVPYCRTETGKRSFIYNGSRIWNNLDDNLKHCLDIDCFKRSYKTLYCNNV